MDNIFKWPFLNEPLYRWFIFVLAMAAFSIAWSFILAQMKAS